jgi:hypothetical protein
MLQDEVDTVDRRAKDSFRTLLRVDDKLVTVQHPKSPAFVRGFVIYKNTQAQIICIHVVSSQHQQPRTGHLE